MRSWFLSTASPGAAWTAVTVQHGQALICLHGFALGHEQIQNQPRHRGPHLAPAGQGLVQAEFFQQKRTFVLHLHLRPPPVDRHLQGGVVGSLHGHRHASPVDDQGDVARPQNFEGVLFRFAVDAQAPVLQDDVVGSVANACPERFGTHGGRGSGWRK